MVLIQVLLPCRGPQGQCLDPQFAKTREELLGAFEGLTAYQRSPALGAWTNPEGHVERDEMVMVEVMADGFDRPWWREYQRRLASPFRATRDYDPRGAYPISVIDRKDCTSDGL
jgi:hypothetical protein